MILDSTLVEKKKEIKNKFDTTKENWSIIHIMLEAEHVFIARQPVDEETYFFLVIGEGRFRFCDTPYEVMETLDKWKSSTV